MISEQTLVLIRNPRDQLLLAEKRRKIGTGFLMAPGGKLDPSDRDLDACARRETRTEVGVIVWRLEYRGYFEHTWDDRDGHNRIHIFFTIHYRYENGTSPIASAEMGNPDWYDINSLPWDSMWPTDKLWLPSVLAGGSLRHHIHDCADATTLYQPLSLTSLN